MIKPEATLVIVAHGSRVSTSNQEVLELTCSISETSPRLKVFAAFMELAEPSLVEVLEDCAMQTTEIVIVLPLFISAGRHVTNDLPAVIRKTAARYPHVCYKLMPHFGANPNLPKMLINQVMKDIEATSVHDGVSYTQTYWAHSLIRKGLHDFRTR